MDAQQVFTLGQQGLMLLLTVSAPLLIVVLVVGLLVSIFQAATQINEQTLSFLPRLLTTLLAIMLAGPWLLTRVLDFTQQLITNIPFLVG